MGWRKGDWSGGVGLEEGKIGEEEMGWRPLGLERKGGLEAAGPVHLGVLCSVARRR